MIIGLIAVKIIFFGNSYTYDGVAETPQEVYDLINEAVMDGRGDITFSSFVHPGFLDFDTILSNAVADGGYAGCEIYSLKYTYQTVSGVYDVHLELSEPSKLHSFLTKIRAKQIASHFEDLPDDYEKIKAVHDYLVLLNRYVYFDGGAYSALYKGRSACTGYAFSFYAIMKELGIPVTMEIGGNHAWNRVQWEGEWYNIDVTWDDNGIVDVNYQYFMRCDSEWDGHHHGGATATSSAPLRGQTARDYYNMVPNYLVIKIILIILIIITPVAILGLVLYKRSRKEQENVVNSAMNTGNWDYMFPIRREGRFEVIIKKSLSPSRSEIWGIENGMCFVERIEEKAEPVFTELAPNVFLDELRFTITVARSKNSRNYCDALLDAQTEINGMTLSAPQAPVGVNGGFGTQNPQAPVGVNGGFGTQNPQAPVVGNGGFGTQNSQPGAGTSENQGGDSRPVQQQKSFTGMFTPYDPNSDR